MVLEWIVAVSAILLCLIAGGAILFVVYAYVSAWWRERKEKKPYKVNRDEIPELVPSSTDWDSEFKELLSRSAAVPQSEPRRRAEKTLRAIVRKLR